MDTVVVGETYRILRDKIVRLKEDNPRYRDLIRWAQENVRDAEAEFDTFSREYAELERLKAVTPVEEALRRECVEGVDAVRATLVSMEDLYKNHQAVIANLERALHDIEAILMKDSFGGVQ